MVNIDFPEWLQNQLDQRNWSQADLTRRTQLSDATISRILSGSRNPGIDSSIKIAIALNLPRDVVLQAAGILAQDNNSRRVAEKIAAYKLSGLDDDQLSEVNKFIDFIKSRDRVGYNDREGITPPVIVKE